MNKKGTKTGRDDYGPPRGGPTSGTGGMYIGDSQSQGETEIDQGARKSGKEDRSQQLDYQGSKEGRPNTSNIQPRTPPGRTLTNLKTAQGISGGVLKETGMSNCKKNNRTPVGKTDPAYRDM
ncbi:hypothetical protein C922_05736 [Plasmodium inui San Antonio 1]|uniref:Uncharacterized protein n=1 Tax=Plasmodium inui San Antonio 1 TaxID=1237626 RepID=W7A467_9APIC|nr:hypothetical protein C922_05736 [Plasmodium inui San Antonio 1]EUD63884.1 hypothetical protein C922_05736 [Plasmodium inui San Antonio 1]